MIRALKEGSRGWLGPLGAQSRRSTPAVSGTDSDTRLRVGEMGQCERAPRGVHEQDLEGEMQACLKDECWVRGGLGS